MMETNGRSTSYLVGYIWPQQPLHPFPRPPRRLHEEGQKISISYLVSIIGLSEVYEAVIVIVQHIKTLTPHLTL